MTFEDLKFGMTVKVISGFYEGVVGTVFYRKWVGSNWMYEVQFRSEEGYLFDGLCFNHELEKA